LAKRNLDYSDASRLRTASTTVIFIVAHVVVLLLGVGHQVENEVCGDHQEYADRVPPFLTAAAAAAGRCHRITLIPPFAVAVAAFLVVGIVTVCGTDSNFFIVQ